MIDSRYARWTAAETSLTVEYAATVVDEIRAFACEGFQRFLRGGIEVGGVLFGTREGKHVRIEAMRKAPIEYHAGPTYSFSEKDRAAFRQVANSHQSDPEMKGMMPVGWFVSHSRSETVAMTDHDAQVFQEFFPERWQVTLVLRPARMGIARAGFFLRNSDGTVGTERSYREFDLSPLYIPTGAHENRREEQANAAAAVASKTAGASSAIPENPAPHRPHIAAAAEQIPLHDFVPTASSARRRRNIWPWITGTLLVLLAAGAAAVYYYWPRPHAPLQLSAADRGSDLQVEWNVTAIRDAESATIETNEAGDSRLFHLPAQALSRGVYPVPHKAGDVNVRMTTYGADGEVRIQEVARYIGKPVVEKPPEPNPELIRLRAENEKLRADLKTETTRTRQLDRRVKALELLMGLERRDQSRQKQ